MTRLKASVVQHTYSKAAMGTVCNFPNKIKAHFDKLLFNISSTNITNLSNDDHTLTKTINTEANFITDDKFVNVTSLAPAA